MTVGSRGYARPILGGTHAIGYESTPDTAISVVAIPEPGTYGLMALGLAAVALVARRRKQA